MPIAHRYKTIFVHVPRTGGGNIEHVLGVRGYDNEGSIRPDETILYGSRRDINVELQHLTVSEIKDTVSSDVYDSYFKFAFVRNPYARLVSDYFWYMIFTPWMSFKEFLTERVGPNKDTDKHFMDQGDFITDENGELRVDYLGRYENYEECLDQVMSRIGLRKETARKPLWVNTAKPAYFTHYSDYYDRETRAIVEELYKKDLDMLSYEFEERKIRFRMVKRACSHVTWKFMRIPLWVRLLPKKIQKLRRLINKNRLVR